MSKWNALIVVWSVLVLGAAACTANNATSATDQVATEVAVAKAVAATLTAEAPPTTTTAPPEVTAIREPTVDTPSTVAPPTVAATLKPTLSAPQPPTPTHTPEPEAADPFVPGVGTPKGLIGKIVLPGYSGPLDSPVFKDSIVFKLVVFDPEIGNVDGAGIQAVNIEAFDPLGRTVIEQRESNWAYCAFGNPTPSPDCEVWRFGEHNFTWPNGTPVCAGSGYSANMIVETDDPAKNEANWRFEFAIESPDGSLPDCF